MFPAEWQMIPALSVSCWLPRLSRSSPHKKIQVGIGTKGEKEQCKIPLTWEARHNSGKLQLL